VAATLRELRGRIRSAGSIKKITKAQEMIATSRIAKAQARVEAARPYDREITNMLTELASASALDHPLLVARDNPRRAAVLVVSSDRGLCGAYNSNVFRRSEELFSLLRSEGKEPILYAVGRKALNYYSFRNWDVHDSWTGFSEQPDYAKNVNRSLKPEYLVLVGVCTHLGCAPLNKFTPGDAAVAADWPGGFYCPCHGSKFDMAGRVFKDVPAPLNLRVPPYAFGDGGTLIIGVDKGAA